MPAVKNSRSEPISRAGLAMMCVSSISEVKPSYCSRSHSFIDRLNAKHCSCQRDVNFEDEDICESGKHAHRFLAASHQDRA